MMVTVFAALRGAGATRRAIDEARQTLAEALRNVDRKQS